jgi:cytochrome b561
MDATLDRLPASLRTMHWLGAALVLLGFFTSGGMEHDEGNAAAWHVLSGLGMLLLFVPRLWLHWKYRGRLTSAQPGFRNRLAWLVHWSLLAFLFVQPVLGILAVWSEGEALVLPFTGWSIASPFAGGIGEWAAESHEMVGSVFYFIVGLHAAAALWHQLFRRDRVLRRML